MERLLFITATGGMSTTNEQRTNVIAGEVLEEGTEKILMEKVCSSICGNWRMGKLMGSVGSLEEC